MACAAAPALPAPLRYPIRPEPVGDGAWLIRGADEDIRASNGGAIANITLFGTSAGAVLVDCGPSLRYGEALAALARDVTGKPVVRAYLTHLHPDHVYASMAFGPGVVAATPALAAQIKAEGPGFSDGMYRLLGDWMRGTESRAPGHLIETGEERFGDRRFCLLPLAGHSASDLTVFDERSGILVAGDLVFHQRAPSTPHADLAVWRTSLDRLRTLGQRSVVPGHGPFDPTPIAAIDQTRDWLDWLEKALEEAVAGGLDMVAAGAIPIPGRFGRVAAARYELQRSVSHLYPGLEARLLPRVDGAG